MVATAGMPARLLNTIRDNKGDLPVKKHKKCGEKKLLHQTIDSTMLGVRYGLLG